MRIQDITTQELEEACWKNYKQIGMKKKGGKQVPNCVPKEGVAEGLSDTIYPNAEVIKSKNGKPVGEIYQDGNSWGAFHYRADRGYDFIDSREEAIEALKDLHQETGRSRPDYTVKGVAEAGSPAQQAAIAIAKKKKKVSEAPIAATDDPNNPMIYGHQKANSMTLQGRISQARAQLKELAELAETNDLVSWERITKLAKGGMFMGLEQNLEQIRHGIEELSKKRAKGGIQSRGIDKNI